MNRLLLFLLLFSFMAVKADAQNEQSINKLLQEQADAWNRGDLEAYMKTYWQSDSLVFVSNNGLTRGWKSALDNYKKSYPDTDAMGKLTFEIQEIKPISAQYCFVVGKWLLHKNVGDFSGYYTLLLRKIKGEWKIVADHSS